MNTAPQYKVLVADDNRSIHQDFAKVLGGHSPSTATLNAAESELFGDPLPSETPTSYHLEFATQGTQAIQMVQAALEQGQPYALAFLDVRMPPGCDGIQTAEQLCALDPDLQIVICTAFSDYTWDDMVKKLGVSDRYVILKKPFEQLELLQLASNLTRKWDLLKESRSKVAGFEKIISQHASEVQAERQKFKSIFENSPEGIFQLSLDGQKFQANPACARLLGYGSTAEMEQFITNVENQFYLVAAERQEFWRRLASDGKVRDFEMQLRHKDGTPVWCAITASTLLNPDGTPSRVQGFLIDITAQKSSEKERHMLEMQLRQAQKLESVGQLAAGIAHEINTPIQFVGDNVRFVGEAFADITRLVQEQRKLVTAARSQTLTPEMITAVEMTDQKINFEFLSNEIPRAVQDSLEGVHRVAAIVGAMKEFSHPGTKEKTPVDINKAIQTTITVARNEWKYVAEMKTDLDPDLPLVPCLPGDFNQVILNLIVNASHAIGDVVRAAGGGTGQITISTRRQGAWAEVRVADTGTGIPEDVQHRIFEPFFTTKEVGRGTGQGLALARATIVKQHGGELFFETTPGRGTTFVIHLPLVAAGTTAEATA